MRVVALRWWARGSNRALVASSPLRDDCDWARWVVGLRLLPVFRVVLAVFGARLRRRLVRIGFSARLRHRRLPSASRDHGAFRAVAAELPVHWLVWFFWG